MHRHARVNCALLCSSQHLSAAQPTPSIPLLKDVAMNLDIELAHTLRKLVDLEPALAQELRDAASLDEAVQLVLDAGDRQGVRIDAAALNAQLQALHQSVATGELTDEQLEGVDGGFMNPLDLLTVYNLFVTHIVKPLPNALQQIKTTLTVSIPPVVDLSNK